MPQETSGAERAIARCTGDIQQPPRPRRARTWVWRRCRLGGQQGATDARRLGDLNPGWAINPNRISSVESRTTVQAGAVGETPPDQRQHPGSHELVRGHPDIRVTAVWPRSPPPCRHQPALSAALVREDGRRGNWNVDAGPSA